MGRTFSQERLLPMSVLLIRPKSVPLIRSALGNATKHAKAEGRSPGSDPVVLERRRELVEAQIREYVLKVVADAPPLTPEQKARLRRLFQTSPAVRAGDGR
jgi:hypothetical protein